MLDDEPSGMPMIVDGVTVGHVMQVDSLYRFDPVEPQWSEMRSRVDRQNRAAALSRRFAAHARDTAMQPGVTLPHGPVTWGESGTAALKPGDITEGGRIVAEQALGLRHHLIDRGTVWLAAEKLPVAERHGWRHNGETAQDGALVQVHR